MEPAVARGGGTAGSGGGGGGLGRRRWRDAEAVVALAGLGDGREREGAQKSLLMGERKPRRGNFPPFNWVAQDSCGAQPGCPDNQVL